MTATRRKPARWRWVDGDHEERELWRGSVKLAHISWSSNGWAWTIHADPMCGGVEFRLIAAEWAAKAALR